MLAVLLAAWIGGRIALWESPFETGSAAKLLLAESAANAGPIASFESRAAVRGPGMVSDNMALDQATISSGGGEPDAVSMRPGGIVPAGAMRNANYRMVDPPMRAAAHQRLLIAAMRSTGLLQNDAQRAWTADYTTGRTISAVPRDTGGFPARAPASARAGSPNRWTLDAWGFWREGSNAAPVSQGRVPIYGASQVGANLQWRARPSSPHDPRVFARAYRAMVRRGENEISLGASARPVPSIPVRVLGELRVTDGVLRTELRPAAFAVTEIAPQKLPFDLTLEAYAQGGYVGGDSATGFADGQIAVTREVARVDSGFAGPVRFSIGGGAWGGAQKGAHRIDIGPTMRVDVAVGEVPARVSIDWREQIGGDAAPASGLAATLSTSF